MSPLSIIDIVKMVLDLFLALWKDRHRPEVARLKAAAVATESFHADRDALRDALAMGDAEAITAHFANLHDKVQTLIPPTFMSKPRLEELP